MSLKKKLKEKALMIGAAVDKYRDPVLTTVKYGLQLTGKATTLSKIAATAGLVSEINRTIIERQFQSSDDNHNLKICTSQITRTIIRYLEANKVITAVTKNSLFSGNYSHLNAYVGDFEGVQVSFMTDTSSDDDGGSGYIIAPAEVSNEEAIGLVTRAYWKLIPKAVLLNGDKLMPYDDEVFRNYVTSNESDLLEAEVKNAFDKKVHRSILIRGTPGSGKTAMVSYVTSRLFKRRLYLTPETTVWTMKNAVIALKPECVVMNDFTITNKYGDLLTKLEELKTYVPIVLLTTNSIDEVPGAVLRPGRVDELITIDHICGEALNRMVRETLGDVYTDAIFETVRGWPMAFICELKARADLGRNVTQTIEELSARVATNDNNNDVDAYCDTASTLYPDTSPPYTRRR